MKKLLMTLVIALIASAATAKSESEFVKENFDSASTSLKENFQPVETAPAIVNAGSDSDKMVTSKSVVPVMKSERKSKKRKHVALVVLGLLLAIII